MQQLLHMISIFSSSKFLRTVISEIAVIPINKLYSFSVWEYYSAVSSDVFTKMKI